MKAIMVMFDSLNRHMLQCYGCDWTHTPNFARLAQRCLTFDRSYVCSMPCMPARRDLHTSRPGFLHRGWGPLEPFDDSVPQMLRDKGTYTHLVSDHYHYWEDGGCNYHTRYSTWDFMRGQEGDPWMAQVADPVIPDNINSKGRRQDWVNRPFMDREELQPQAKTFAAGLEFLERNRETDNWFLQIETFDPHEPFFSQQHYKDLYPHGYTGPLFDWPAYRAVDESPEQVQHCRYEYAALLSMCDAYLGKILDAMDQYAMWEDTMLIVWTDHGFLLGEHNMWAKVWCPWYQELANTPFFVHDPRAPRPGERRQALVQPSLDLGPTLLEFFGLQKTPDMLGKSLSPVIQDDTPVREAAIFGSFNGAFNVTDGRHVLMQGTQGVPKAPQFTLMPAQMRDRVDIRELQDLELAGPFSFTKGVQVLRIGGTPTNSQPGDSAESLSQAATNGREPALLFDIEADPGQVTPLQDAALEEELRGHLERLMRECDAPAEQFARLGLSA